MDSATNQGKQGGFRNVKTDPFRKYYDKKQDQTKPYIEEKDEKTGEKTRRVPTGMCISLFDLSDEEIGDYLSPEELKKMRQVKLQKDQNKNRDLCKEWHDSEENKKKNREDLINEQAQKISELQNIIIEHNKLLSQIVNKIKNI